MKTLLSITLLCVLTPTRLIAGEPLTMKQLRAEIEEARAVYSDSGSAKLVLPEIRKTLRKQAVKFFGGLKPGNEKTAEAFSGIDLWIDFEQHYVAPYLAYPEKREFPAYDYQHLSERNLKKRVVPIEPELASFLDLWRTKDKEMQLLADARQKLVKHTAAIYKPQYSSVDHDETIFDRQFDLEFYLRDRLAHRDRLFKLGYAEYGLKGIEFAKRFTWAGEPVQVKMRIKAPQTTNIWYDYHRWYYTKAAGSEANVYFRKFAGKKPRADYKEVKAFEEEVGKIGMGDFLKRWQENLERAVVE